ncbi:heavy-metal-associated domain-containing protein [Oscillospiraceae bacterium LTW-04]|nr:heavy metal-associated domain-containing protein [Oscillospiraceae bacterium MB24-C1]
MNQILCSVSGIQNKEQKTQIKNSLNKIDGVREVGVNLTTGTVDIKYNDPATEADIKNCIETTGFKIVYE